jgi:hypothetical protein
MTASAAPARPVAKLGTVAAQVAGRFDLLPLLVALALLELVLRALLSNTDVAIAAYRYIKRPENVGFFAYHAAALLAVGVIVEQLLRLGTQPRLRGAAMWAIGFGVLVPAAAAAQVALQLRPSADFARAQAALQLGLVLLLFGVAVAAGTLRARVGLGLVTVPYLLEALAVLGAGNPKVLALAGGSAQALWPLAGFAVFFCFDPVPPSAGRSSRGAFASARLGVAVVALVVAMLIARRPNELSIFVSLTRGLFGLSLSPERAPVFLAAWLLAGTGAMTLWFAGGAARRVSYGVVLLIIAGLKAPVGLHSVLLVAGLTTVFSGVLDMSAVAPAGQAMDRPFDQVVESLRALVGGPRAEMARITVGEVGREVVQLRGQSGPLPARVRLVKGEALLMELELTLGEAPPREPDLRLSSGTEPPDAGATGKRFPIGDPDFDRLFTTRLRPVEAGAPSPARARELVDDPEARERIRAQLRGTLTVWSGQALRYRAVPGLNCDVADLGLGALRAGTRDPVTGASLERLAATLTSLATQAGVPTVSAPAQDEPAAPKQEAAAGQIEAASMRQEAASGQIETASIRQEAAAGQMEAASTRQEAASGQIETASTRQEAPAAQMEAARTPQEAPPASQEPSPDPKPVP